MSDACWRESCRLRRSNMACSLWAPRFDHERTVLCRDWPRSLRHDRRDDVSGDLQRFTFCSAQRALAMEVTGRPPWSGDRHGQRFGLWRHDSGHLPGAGLGTAGVSARGTFSGGIDRLGRRFCVGTVAGARSFLEVRPDRPGAHALSRAGRGPVQHSQSKGALCSSRTTLRLPTGYS